MSVRKDLAKMVEYPNNGIFGGVDEKNGRIEYLVHYMIRIGEGRANRKWLDGHAAELAHYIAEIKGM